MIDRLEEAGHVERRRDPNDRRAWRIHMTDAAKPMLEDIRHIAEGLFADAVEGLSPSAQAELMTSLETIRANLTDKPAQEAANG